MERLFGTADDGHRRILDNPPKGHTGNSDLYQFHRETVRRELAENADENIKPEKTT